MIKIIIKSIFAVFLLINTSLASQALIEQIKKDADIYSEKGFYNGIYRFSDNNGNFVEGVKGYYTKNENEKIELSVTNRMPIASATKTFTAAGILKLQERGLLNVKDTVAKHLDIAGCMKKDDKVPDWANKVTIHHLLTHTSGLAEYFMGMELNVMQSHDRINDDIMHFVASKELVFEPGSKYVYNNSNYVLLGLIIEKISGKDLSHFYSEEFFQPLGLKNTELLDLAKTVKNQIDLDYKNDFPTRYFITPTANSEPVFSRAQSPFIMVPYADGGLASNLEDMITWHQALQNGKVLSPESYKMMTAKHMEVKKNFGMRNYVGYGLYTSEFANGLEVINHAGDALGIRSEAGCIKGTGICFSALSNTMVYVPKELKDKVDLSQTENQIDIRFLVSHVINNFHKEK